MKRFAPILLAGMLALTSAAWSQLPRPPARLAPTPGEAAPTPSAPISLRYDRAPLSTVARELGERGGRRVLLDSTARAGTPVTVTAEARDLEDGLTRVTALLGLSWRKVYMPPAPTREGVPKEWTGDQVRAAAAAVEALERSGVIVEERGRATLFMRSVPAATDFEAKVRLTWPQMKPYYLISHPKARAPRENARRDAAARRPGEGTPEEFADLERQRMEAFMRLSPDGRATAMSQAMDLMLQADPTVMQEMMQAGMQAWMQSMQRMTPEQRGQLIQRQMQMMQSIPPEVWQDLFSLFRPQAPTNSP